MSDELLREEVTGGGWGHHLGPLIHDTGGGAHHSDKLFERETITSSRRMKIINVLVERQIISKISFRIIKTNFWIYLVNQSKLTINEKQ